jgi:hypothetical protein
MSAGHRVWERVQRAWPVTIGLHVFQCLFAATFALPFVSSVSVPAIALRAQSAEWLGVLKLGEAFNEGSMLRGALPLALAALNYPWLSVAWLRALTEEAPFMEHARYALARYRSAIGVAAMVVVSFGVLVGGCSLAARGVRAAFGDALDARAIDLAALACYAPVLLGGVWFATLLDAGYAAVSGDVRSLRAVAQTAAARTTVRLVGAKALLLLGQAVLSIAAWAVPRIALGPGPAADFVVLVSTQSAAFLITCGRAVWLAYVLEPRRL